jgi:hypothetical protein
MPTPVATEHNRLLHFFDDFEVAAPDLAIVTKTLSYSWSITTIPGTGSAEGASIAARFIFKPEFRIKVFNGRPSTNEPAQEQASEWIL